MAAVVQVYGTMNFSSPEDQRAKSEHFYLKFKLKDLSLKLNGTSSKILSV